MNLWIVAGFAFSVGVGVGMFAMAFACMAKRSDEAAEEMQRMLKNVDLRHVDG